MISERALPMNNNVMRVAAFTILLTRVKIKRSSRTSEKGEVPPRGSGKAMVDYFAQHQKSKPEDWELVEKVVKESRRNNML
jgi:hypothetical protein